MDQLTSIKQNLLSKAINKLKVLIILTHSPMTRINSVRMVLIITALKNLEVNQIDVKIKIWVWEWDGLKMMVDIGRGRNRYCANEG